MLFREMISIIIEWDEMGLKVTLLSKASYIRLLACFLHSCLPEERAPRRPITVIQADYAINVGGFFVIFSTSDRVINCAFLPDLTALHLARLALSHSLSILRPTFPRREEIAVSFREVGRSQCVRLIHAYSYSANR